MASGGSFSETTLEGLVSTHSRCHPFCLLPNSATRGGAAGAHRQWILVFQRLGSRGLYGP